MNTDDPRFPMLITAAVGLLLLLAFCGAVLVMIGRSERIGARIAAVTGRKPGEVEPLFPLSGIAAFAPGRPSLIERIATVFGVNLLRAKDYPVRWWVVVIVALPLSRVTAGLGATLVGDWFILTMPLQWVFLCRRFFAWAEERRRIALFRQFPDALAMIVRAVRVGIPVSDAIAGAARESPQPTAREFQAMSDRMSIGMQMQEALLETAMRNGVAEYRFFATALALQLRTGGSPTEALDNLAEVIRKRVALQERGRALASQARASAIVLAILPVFTAVLLMIIDFNYMSLLFTDPFGRQILGSAIALLTIGMTIMRTMIKKSLG